MIFYAWGNVSWALILILVSIIDFKIAQKIHLINLEQEETNSLNNNIQKKILLIFSITANIGLLCFFKYWNWFVVLLEGITQFNFLFLKHKFSTPAAISFYTFETLSYTIDIYRKKFKPTKNFIDYLSFISFFPKLVAGPIKRAHELLPQLTKFRNKISPRMLDFAIFMIFWGLFKKIVFADNLGHLVERCYENINVAGVGFLLSICFAFQIYCDFSAYCDIARGSAKLFSIKLNRNFLTPYFSSNPVEFFQRWNITLSTWIRDYVYIPLGGSKRGKIRNIFNIYITMILVGLWHGTNLFFVVYGIYFATVAIFYKTIAFDQILLKKFGNKFGKILSIILGFFFVIMGMGIFWVNNFKDFIVVFKSFFQIFPIIFAIKDMEEVFKILSYGAFIFVVPIVITDFFGFIRKREFIDFYPVFKTRIKIFIYLIMFYLILFFASRGSYDFIYFQF
jgi:D-alanyl-lipoteichoic acid acyltransferase DltB (MBOAT superfamily)